MWLTALLLLLLPPAVTPAGATEHTVGVAPGDEKTVAIRTTELGERHDLIVRNDAHPDSHDFVTGKDPGEEIVGSSDTALWERTNDTVHTKNYTVIGTQPGQNLWLEVRVSFVPKAAGGGGGAPPPDATVLVPGAFLVSLTFTSGEGIDDDHHPVYRDPVPNEPDEPYPVPHWHRDRDAGDQSPVCYRSGVNIVVDGEWELLPATAWPNGEYVVTGYRVVNQLPGPKLVEAAGTAAGGTLTISGAVFEDPLPDTVDYEEAMEIHWTISAPEAAQGTDQVDAGRSANELYVLLNAPIESQGRSLWHSLVHLACAYSKGQDDPLDVFEGIWSRFDIDENHSGISNRKGLPIAYYSDWLVEHYETRDLLAHRDGQCGAFARLLLECLRVHGIAEGEFVVVESPLAEFILIEKWKYDETGSGGDPLYTHVNTHLHIDIDPPLFGIYNDSTYLWLSSEVTSEDGWPGQSKANPLSIFENHQFIKFNQNYYDPSYGTSYDSILEFQQTMVAGFFGLADQQQLDLANNYWYWLRKVRPPHPTQLQLTETVLPYPFE